MKPNNAIHSRIGLLSFWIKDSEQKIKMHKDFLQKHKKEMAKLLRQLNR